MNSYKNLFLIKGMTCWNGLSSWMKWISDSTYSIYETIYYWFQSDRNAWYLYADTSFPLMYRYAYGLETAKWKYHPVKKELVYLPCENGVSNMYRIGWLSAQTTIDKKTKDMESFLSDLCIKSSSENEFPPIMVLLQAWSIYDKKWWSGMDSVRLEWIDEFAEEGSATRNETPRIPLVLLDSHLLKRKN